jgi:hypothetical protein
MIRNILLLGLLLGLTLPGFSQGRDTAFAVQKLFRQKRGNGEAWTATGAAVAATETTGFQSANRPNAANLAAAAINGGVPALLGLEKAARYSAEREALILKTYSEGWPIPADIRRQLRRKHFHRTSKDVLRP